MPAEGVAEHQDELHGDVELVEAYGAGVPDEWVGVRFDGARLVVLFTDAERHRAAVLALVAHPGSVDVRTAPYSRRYLDSVYEQATALLDENPHSWSMLSPGLTEVQVMFNGGHENFARQLHERFGAAVELRVGLHPFPLGPISNVPPEPQPESTIDVADAVFETVPDAVPVAVGAGVRGFVSVTNMSTQRRLRLSTDQPLDGVLLDAAGVVSRTGGFRVGTGLVIDLGPGQRAQIAFYADTDALDPRLGTTLPAGNYQLVVIVPIRDRSSTEHIVTPSVPVRIGDQR